MTYPHFANARTRQRSASKKHGNTPPSQLPHAAQERVNAIAYKILDAAERILDTVAVPPAEDRLAVTATRRQVANTLALWKVCANARCCRSRCCRGEPTECLSYGLPLMPDALVGLLKMRQPRKRREPRLPRAS